MNIKNIQKYVSMTNNEIVKPIVFICKSDIAEDYSYVCKNDEQYEALINLVVDDETMPLEHKKEEFLALLEEDAEGTLASLFTHDETGDPLLFEDFETVLKEHFNSVQQMVSALAINSSANMTDYNENEPVSGELANQQGTARLLNDDDLLSGIDGLGNLDLSGLGIPDELVEEDNEFTQVVNYFRTIEDKNIQQKFVSIVSRLLLESTTPSVVVEDMYEAIVLSFITSYKRNAEDTKHFMEHFMNTFSAS